MKLYRLDEVPIRGDDQVFKASPTGPLIAFMVFSGIAAALLLLEIDGVKIVGLSLPPAFFIYAAAATFGLFGWMALGQFRACVKTSNWLLRCHGSGVIIHYRSFQNWRCPAGDVQAVGFDYAEIAWVRTVKERRTSPGIGRNQQTQVLTYLDFCLANADTSTLETHLQAEQKAEPPGRIKTIVRDYPVEVLPGGIVQLRWNGIRPSPGQALQYLSQYVKIGSADSARIDLTDHSNSSPGEEDAKILKLANSGDKMGAVKLTRQLYGSTLTEAVAFVEKLQSGNAES